MRDEWQDRLTMEITRQQFLQYMGGAILIAFGLGNLVSLLTGSRFTTTKYLPQPASNNASGFGNRKFGQ
jgi:hypothetical protein